MKTKRYPIIILFFFLIYHSTQAQLNVGFSVSPLFVKGSYTKNMGTEAFPQIEKKDINHTFYNVQMNVGYDFSLFKFNENKMAFGTAFRIAGGYFMANELFENQISIDLPQYITFRYGRRSSPLNEKNWGLGLGIGYHFRLVPLPVAIPGVFADYTFKKNLFVSISADVIPANYYSYFSSEGLVPAFHTRQLSIILGYIL